MYNDVKVPYSMIESDIVSIGDSKMPYAVKKDGRYNLTAIVRAALHDWLAASDRDARLNEWVTEYALGSESAEWRRVILTERDTAALMTLGERLHDLPNIRAARNYNRQMIAFLAVRRFART